MPYHLVLVQLLLALMSLFLLWQSIVYIKHRLLVKRIQKEPFPAVYEDILNQIPYYRKIPQNYLPLLHYQIRLFIEEKEWEGVYTEVTLQMKVTVAFFACLLGMGNRYTYDNLTTIMIYPYEYIAKEVENFGGIFHKQKYILEGQSVGDTVIISWHSGKKDIKKISAHNVLIHEFAHEFDFQSGEINGMPPLDSTLYNQWAQHIYSTYEKLNKKILKNRFLNRYKIFGRYGGKNEAEFFAVSTELFFGQPQKLYKHFPKLYKTLQKFYKLDPKEFIG
ncbi:MAG: zinc-dependent peptidase [Campylobacterota bacterium]